MQAAYIDKDTRIQRRRTELQRVTEAAALQEEAARQQVPSIRNQSEQRQMHLAVILWPSKPLWHDGCHVMQAISSNRDAELQRLRSELQRVTEAAAQQEDAARQEVLSIRSEAEQRQMQLAVIMETLEALQSGSDGQHLINHVYCCQCLLLYQPKDFTILFLLIPSDC